MYPPLAFLEHTPFNSLYATPSSPCTLSLWSLSHFHEFLDAEEKVDLLAEDRDIHRSVSPW